MKKSIFALCPFLFCSCVSFVGNWGEPPRFTSFESSQPAQNENRLEARIELNVGKLEIQPGDASTAYRLDLYYDENGFSPEVDFRRDGDTARLGFELGGAARQASRGLDKTRLNLRLNPDTPLSLDARAGVGESEIDLSGMKIADMRLTTGVGETSLGMLSPNRIGCRTLSIKSGVGSLEIKGLGNFGFDRFQFEGGVGSAQLDFSGAWETIGEIDVTVGVGGVEILLPRSLGAEIRSSRSFLSSLELSDFRREGDVFISRNRDRVDKILRLKIEAGIGGVEVRWI